MSFSLAPETHMGVVTLRVADLDLMRTYYRDVLTLQELSESTSSVTLGRNDVPIVQLSHAPELKHASPGQAGLFHTAILFESQAALAAAVFSVATQAPGTYTGSADHLVSQAFYFDDPEGNGIELYWDRNKSEWTWIDGSIQMDTLYLDPQQFITQHLSQESTQDGSVSVASVGHVHLSIGDIDVAKKFYVEDLGFDLTFNMRNTALFVSAGGYHHHMGLNIWNSRGAGRRQLTLGLGEVDILLPTREDLLRVSERLSEKGHQIRDDGQSIYVEDPWANQIKLGSNN